MVSRGSISSFAATFAACLGSSLLLTGCDTSEQDLLDGGDPSTWRELVMSDDALVRAAGVDRVLGAPGDDAASVLEGLALEDPAPRVREQATLAYASLLGPDATPLLKSVALSDGDTAVQSAALASLARIAEDHPVPPRGWLDVDFPNTFTPGEPFDVKVRFGSSEDVPEAMLQVRLPPGFRSADERGTSWQGQLSAGLSEELTFTVIGSRAPLQSGARVRLKLDYAEQLDVELLAQHVRLAQDDHAGRFEEQPAPIVRDP